MNHIQNGYSNLKDNIIIQSLIDLKYLAMTIICLCLTFAHKYFTLQLLSTEHSADIKHRFLYLASKLTGKCRWKNDWIQFLNKGTETDGYRQLRWINRLIFFIWPHINSAIFNGIKQIRNEERVEYGEFKFGIERLTLGSNPPFISKIIIHDESTHQINPEQMVIDLEIIYESTCVAIFNCECPIFGTIKAGIQNFKGNFPIRLIFRPIEINGLGGVCICFYDEIKIDFVGVEAAYITNNPVVKKILTRSLIESIPMKYCVPWNEEKIRKVLCPCPYAICIFKAACKQRPKKIYCCTCYGTVYIHLKIGEKRFKVEVARSLDRAVWHSTDINDYIDTFTLSREETFADPSKLYQLNLGSLIKNDSMGRLIRVPPIADEIDDHLTIQLIVMKLSTSSRNLSIVLWLMKRRWPRVKLPIGFMMLFIHRMSSENFLSDCSLKIQIGNNVIELNRNNFHHDASIKTNIYRIEQCIQLPFGPNDDFRSIIFDLTYNSKTQKGKGKSNYILDIPQVFTSEKMETNFQISFSNGECILATLFGFIEITCVSSVELFNIFSTRSIL